MVDSQPAARRFRFGAGARSATSADHFKQKARRAEELGYSTLLVPDHFADGRPNRLGPIAALAFAAGVTEHIRLGSLVFNNDARHPVLLAQEAATIDLLSSGRLEFGIGCGWYKTEYDRAGLAFNDGPERVARMRESVRVIRSLFADEMTDYAGDAYRVSNLNGQPRPVQHPHPPILIGGGSRRLLTLAADEANIIGIGPRALPQGGLDPQSVRAAKVDKQLSWIREAAGLRFESLELHIYVQHFEVTHDRLGSARAIASDFEVAAETLLDTPHVLMGTIDQICEALVEFRSRWGLSYFSVQESAVEAFAPIVERLGGQ